MCSVYFNFMLDQLEAIQGIDFGLYRDDGLGCSSLTARQTDRVQAKVKKIFKDNDLKITMEVNMQVVSFLDVTMDLKNDTFRPFMKPNNTIQYIHTQSNHPPTVLKQIPLPVNKRLSTISARGRSSTEPPRPTRRPSTRVGSTTSWPSTRRSRGTPGGGAGPGGSPGSTLPTPYMSPPM